MHEHRVLSELDELACGKVAGTATANPLHAQQGAGNHARIFVRKHPPDERGERGVGALQGQSCRAAALNEIVGVGVPERENMGKIGEKAQAPRIKLPRRLAQCGADPLKLNHECLRGMTTAHKNLRQAT